MDLGSILGLNSRFGAVWEGSRAFPHWVRSLSLNSLVYQRVLGRCFLNFLDDSAPALPDIFRSLLSGHCRIGGVVRLCEWSRLNVMKNRWSIKNSRRAVMEPSSRKSGDRESPWLLSGH